MTKKVKLTELPHVEVSSGHTLTIFEIGNAERGVYPTSEDMIHYASLIKEATKKKSSSIFVPEGLVKVRQICL